MVLVAGRWHVDFRDGVVARLKQQALLHRRGRLIEYLDLPIAIQDVSGDGLQRAISLTWTQLAAGGGRGSCSSFSQCVVAVLQGGRCVTLAVGNLRCTRCLMKCIGPNGLPSKDREGGRAAALP